MISEHQPNESEKFRAPTTLGETPPFEKAEVEQKDKLASECIGLAKGIKKWKGLQLAELELKRRALNDKLHVLVRLHGGEKVCVENDVLFADASSSSLNTTPEPTIEQL